MLGMSTGNPVGQSPDAGASARNVVGPTSGTVGATGQVAPALGTPVAVTTAAILGQPMVEIAAGIIPPLRKFVVLAALGNPVRFRMVVELCDGRPRTITQLARVVRRDPDLIARHLKLLRRAGVVVLQKGVDRRCSYFYVPAAFRATAGRLDFGCVNVAVD